MLAKRIIACLDVAGGRVVKGVGFLALRDAGDPVALAERYSKEGADEIVFLDIGASHEKRSTMVELVAETAKRVFVPLTVGGGVSSVADARALLRAGADKVAINSAALKGPDLISQISEVIGAQATVVAIDAKRVGEAWQVYSHGGRRATEREAVEWASEAVERGAGEILLTSMDADGSKSGFDIELTRAVGGAVSVPVIASGGAGSVEHFIEVFQKGRAQAALAASIFHYEETSVWAIKQALGDRGMLVRER